MMIRVRKLASMQYHLLYHALTDPRFRNLRRVVYSTCSVFWEENEGVVMRVMAEPAVIARGWQLSNIMPMLPSQGSSSPLMHTQKGNGTEEEEGVVQACWPTRGWKSEEDGWQQQQQQDHHQQKKMKKSNAPSSNNNKKKEEDEGDNSVEGDEEEEEERSGEGAYDEGSTASSPPSCDTTRCIRCSPEADKTIGFFVARFDRRIS